jgi:hypothetical protein
MASSRSTLNVLLQELQTVLPKALDVCSGGGGGGGGGGGAAAAAAPGGSRGGEDVVLSRLRSVLFALLHSCLSCRPSERARRVACGAAWGCCGASRAFARRATPLRAAPRRPLRLHPRTMPPTPHPPTVKAKETHSVLRVTTVVLDRLPSVFAGGAQPAALLKLLQLLAEPSAYASP